MRFSVFSAAARRVVHESVSERLDFVSDFRIGFDEFAFRRVNEHVDFVFVHVNVVAPFGLHVFGHRAFGKKRELDDFGERQLVFVGRAKRRMFSGWGVGKHFDAVGNAAFDVAAAGGAFHFEGFDRVAQGVLRVAKITRGGVVFSFAGIQTRVEFDAFAAAVPDRGFEFFKRGFFEADAVPFASEAVRPS